jgi:hypothetical protein
MAFANIKQVLWAGDNLWPGFEANESISAGMVVTHAATGVSFEVVKADGTAGERPIGVALFGAKDGDKITVAGDGCIVYVMADSAVDAGDYVEASNISNAGAVMPVTDIANASTNTSLSVTYTRNAYIVGQAVEDISAGGTGRIIVRPYVRQVINAV